MMNGDHLGGVDLSGWHLAPSADRVNRKATGKLEATDRVLFNPFCPFHGDPIEMGGRWEWEMKHIDDCVVVKRYQPTMLVLNSHPHSFLIHCFDNSRFVHTNSPCIILRYLVFISVDIVKLSIVFIFN